MRVISGIYKGRKLVSSKDLHIRPTTDRVKEFIFNILHDYPQDKMVADIFSGSGNLGIEALSRGARKTVFVDNSNNSMHILKKNIESLKIPKDGYDIRLEDAINFVKNSDNIFDLYLIDPPFDYPPLQNLLDTMFKNPKINNDSLVVLEHEITNNINESSNKYEIIKQKKFGRSLISFLIKKGSYET
jgi:16S rRNA (guanine966-N2)-methyltransferase